MTVLAAVYDPERRSGAMASDRQVTVGDRPVVLGEPKIYAVGNAIVGYCGASGAILHVHSVIAEIFRETDFARDPVREIRAQSATLLAALVELKELYSHSENQDSLMDAGAVFLTPAGIIVLDTFLASFPVATTYYADGSGGPVAMGYLEATQGRSPAKRVRGAVEAACTHDVSCSPPIDLLTCKK